jgi:hypothetical protein
MHPNGIEPFVSETGVLQTPCPPWAKMLKRIASLRRSKEGFLGSAATILSTTREIRTHTVRNLSPVSLPSWNRVAC